MPETEKKPFSPYKLFVGMFIVCLFAALVSIRIIDNDTWWLLALGRNITATGIPTADPLSMHDMQFVSQQWLSSVIFYNVYNVFGAVGLYILCRICNVALIALVYTHLQTHCQSRTVSLLVTALTTVPLLSMFGVLRPQIFTYIIILTEGLLLEKYTKTANKRYLYALPLLSVLQINLHASMWFMQFILYLPYVGEKAYKWLSETVFRRRDEIDGQFKTLPIIIAGIASAACGLINPYGVKAITYVFGSYGVDSINSSIMEMAPLSFDNAKPGVILVLCVIMAFCLFRTKTPLRYALFLFGFAFLAFSTVKTYAYFLLFAVPAVAVKVSGHPYIQTLDATERSKKRRNACIVVCAVLIALLPIKDVITAGRQGIDGYDRLGIAEVVNYAEEHTNIDKSSKIYAGYNTGGYLEYRGYKPYLDARAEVFLPSNNKEFDYYNEYITAKANVEAANMLIEKYDFEYIITSKDDAVEQCLIMQTEYGQCNYTLVFMNEREKTDALPNELWVKTELLPKEERN